MDARVNIDLDTKYSWLVALGSCFVNFCIYGWVLHSPLSALKMKIVLIMDITQISLAFGDRMAYSMW